MDPIGDPVPAHIGPIREGQWLYSPVRRLTQVMVTGAMGLLIAIEWLACLLRLE